MEAEQLESTGEEVETSENKKKINFGKRIIFEVVGGLALIVSLIGLFSFSAKYKGKEAEAEKLNEKYESIEEDYESMKQENSELSTTVTELSEKCENLESEKEEISAKVTELNDKIDELENGASAQLVTIKNSYEKGKWKEVIELASKLHEKYNGSPEDKEAQGLAKKSQEKIDEEKAAKEAEKAKGYETGITYNQLARTPDDYIGKKVKFKGRVVQVIEGSTSVQIRLAVDDNYDTILLGEYASSTVSSRVLEDDYITIYGTSVGIISYQSTMGGTITIPGVYIDKIDQ